MPTSRGPIRYSLALLAAISIGVYITLPENVSSASRATVAVEASRIPPMIPAPPPVPDPSEDFFNKGIIPTIRIRLTKEEEAKLRADQRRYVECTLIENETNTFKKVRVKLKGAAGSFRNLDDRPAMTINMGSKKHSFHGLDKFHLNNSVQDESYLSEMLCSHIIREAGYPATRTTHARVYLNDRDLGFYVLKEGFDEHWLARNFKSNKGRLFDGGFCQDIDANLQLDEGENPDDRTDLKALIAACREGDPAKRHAMIAERLDIDAFLKAIALELMMCHWDGYAQNRNNYRVYFRAEDKKAMFFLHGMDQMFQDPNFGVMHVPGPIVTSAVLNNPEWRTRYRQIVREILPHFAPEKLHAKIDEAHKRIRPELAKIHEDRAKQFDGRAQEFKNRVAPRQKAILAQFPPEPVPFGKDGVALIEGWTATAVGDSKLEKRTVDGKEVLAIETGASNACVSSFRTKLRLPRGSFRLEAKVKTNNVKPLEDATGSGAGIRISGGNRQNQPQNKAVGTADWTTVSYALDIPEELREVDVVIELRSTAGSALFEVSSLKAVKVK